MSKYTFKILIPSLLGKVWHWLGPSYVFYVTLSNNSSETRRGDMSVIQLIERLRIEAMVLDLFG